MKHELICICCPMGCALTAEVTDAGITVTGNTCKRGEQYAITELTAPTRTVTSTVRLRGGEIARVPVRTSVPVPKDKMFDVMREIHGAAVTAPVGIGDVIIKGVAGTDADIIATRGLDRKGDRHE